MAKIIKQRQFHESVEYRLEYRWKDSPNAGFSFACDAKGQVHEHELEACALENYRKCVSGEHAVVCEGVKEYAQSWSEPAILRCDCGSNLELFGFTNPCDNCGRDYSMSGELLAPRSQWGEETGEHWADIIWL